MTNIMTSVRLQVKTLVSKKKKRYIKDTFNLDLSYITDNIIAMGYPSIKMEGYYRNHIDEVIRFFDTKHKDEFRVYNLCSERHYDHRKFNNRVAEFPFHDHNPPHIEQIEEFCVDTHQFLIQSPKHVAAIHCKAGKGRTGTMICCYMLHAGLHETADKALEAYGIARTHDGKGVTIPSQRRYVNYYANIIRYSLKYERIVMQLAEIRLTHCPHLTQHSSSVHFSISFVADNKETLMYSAELPDVKRTLNAQNQLVIQMTECMPLAGDIKIELFHKAKMMRKKHMLLRFWFNTFFVCESLKSRPDRQPEDRPHRTQCDLDVGGQTVIENSEFVLLKDEVDFVHKDKRHRLFPENFQVFVRMRRTAPGPEPMVGSSQQSEHVRAGNGGAVCLARTTEDSQSTEASSSSSSGGSSSASGGSSSNGEDWESETHKSHPIDTNSTTSTITTQSATAAANTTTNNNNINNNNSIISQQQQQQQQQQQPTAAHLLLSSHQRVHRVEQHRPPPPPPPPRQQHKQHHLQPLAQPQQHQVHHSPIDTHQHHHYQHQQLHLAQLSQPRSAPPSTTCNPLAALSLAAISTASSGGSDDHSICCNTPRNHHHHHHHHHHHLQSAEISALIADAADADPDAQSSPSTSSSASTDDEYDEVFEPSASQPAPVVAGWECPRATTVVVRTTSQALRLPATQAASVAATVATVAATHIHTTSTASAVAAEAAPALSACALPSPHANAGASIGRPALAAPPAAAAPGPTPISMMLTRVTSSISKSSSVCSALFRSKRRSKAAAAAAAAAAAGDSAPASSGKASPVLLGGGCGGGGGGLLLRQSSGPVQLQSVSLSPPVTPPPPPPSASPLADGSSGSNLSSTSSAGAIQLAAATAAAANNSSSSGSGSEDDGQLRRAAAKAAARGTRGSRGGGGGGGGVRGGAKMLAYFRRNFSRRRST